MRFTKEYWEQLLEQAKVSSGPIRDAYSIYTSRTSVTSRSKGNHPFYQNIHTWDQSAESGRNLMFGKDVSMSRFIKTHTRSMQPWQKLAFIWAMNHPDMILEVESDRFAWEVYRMGEYVEFFMPDHGKGGEKVFISRTGKTMLWINSD